MRSCLFVILILAIIMGLYQRNVKCRLRLLLKQAWQCVRVALTVYIYVSLCGFMLHWMFIHV